MGDAIEFYLQDLDPSLVLDAGRNRQNSSIDTRLPF
jgi:hypothetical protein